MANPASFEELNYAIDDVLSAESINFIELAGMLELDPKHDFSGANLSGCDLSGCDLSSADLSRTDLSNANLRRANFSGANLSDANLSHANLRSTNLNRANLSGADLSQASLFNVKVDGTILSGCKGLTAQMADDLKQRGAISEVAFNDPTSSADATTFDVVTLGSPTSQLAVESEQHEESALSSPVLTIDRFYRAVNPARSLHVEDPQDRKYYVDFSPVRDRDQVLELRRVITMSPTDEPTYQLFVGQIGCGKTTELMRLKVRLEDEGFHTVYVDASNVLDMGDIDVSDILLAIANELIVSLESIDIRVRSRYLAGLLSEIRDVFERPTVSAEGEMSLGIAKVSSQIRENPQLRVRLRQHLDPLINNLLEAINGELIEPANQELRNRGTRSLVLIVDNLDRMDNSLKLSGRSQPQHLFLDRGAQLKQFNCHIVYAAPAVLMSSKDLAQLTNCFDLSPKVLPMVPVRLQNGAPCERGLKLLQQVVLSRAFPNISPQERLEMIPELFDSFSTLNQLCHISGGHLRNLLRLLRECLRTQDLPISRNCLEQIIAQERKEFSRMVTKDEWRLLERMKLGQENIRDHSMYSGLLRKQYIFEYQYNGLFWDDINPILDRQGRSRNKLRFW